jgi:hypothetical protein
MHSRFPGWGHEGAKGAMIHGHDPRPTCHDAGAAATWEIPAGISTPGPETEGLPREIVGDTEDNP